MDAAVPILNLNLRAASDELINEIESKNLNKVLLIFVWSHSINYTLTNKYIITPECF